MCFLFTVQKSRHPGDSTKGIGETQLVARRRAAKMLIAVVVMFGICYLPVHLLNIIRYGHTRIRMIIHTYTYINIIRYRHTLIHINIHTHISVHLLNITRYVQPYTDKIALTGATKSTLLYRSVHVHVLYTEICILGGCLC